MLKKLNNKGFTLIEMLVVIAIIAVLVAIAIPTVTSATDKAAAATNAANLRSYKAAVTTAYLADAKGITIAESTGAVTIDASVKIMEKPEAKAMDGVEKTAELKVKYVAATGEFVVTYGDYTIEDFSEVADGTYKTVTEAHTANTKT